MSDFFDRLPQTSQFVILSAGLFFFFGAHNLLQEAIMGRPSFSYGWMLGYLEVLGVTVMSYLEMTLNEGGGRMLQASPKSISESISRPNKFVMTAAGIKPYLFVAGCLMASSSLSNIALNYINYPTKVVFRSCKLLPTMALATVINKKRFTSVEYLSALAICAGLILFAKSDWKHGGPDFNPVGMLLVTLSVCADSITPNAQERLFKDGKSR